MDEQEEECLDENSKLGRLIVRTNRLLERPVIDNSLSDILDLLLKNMNGSFADFPINRMSRFSFPEAALLIHGCGNLYSKRVDLLWSTVNECQKRMISFQSEENKKERERLEEREQKYKRRRRNVAEVQADSKKNNEKNAENFGLDWDEIANFHPSNCEKNPKLFSDWCKKMEVNRDLQPVDRANRSRPEKYCHFRSAKDEITDKDQDDELVVHTSKMESVIALDELFSSQKDITDDFAFELIVESKLKQKFMAERQVRYEDFEKCSAEFEKFVSFHKDDYFCNAKRLMKSSTSETQQQKMRRISVTSTIISQLNQSDTNRIYCQTCQVNVPRLSIDQLSRLSRMSVDDIFECSRMFNNTENFQESKMSLEGQTCQAHGDKLSIDNLSKLSGLPVDEVKGSSGNFTSDEKVSNDDNPGMLEVLEKKNDALDGIKSVEPTIAQTTDNVEVPSELDNIDHGIDNPPENIPMETESDNHQEIVENVVLNQAENQQEIVEKIESNQVEKVVKVSKQKICDEIAEDDDEFQTPRKRRKLSKAALRKLATGITANLRNFNVFYSAHYQPEEGEGEVEILEFERGDPILNSSFIEEDPEDEHPLSQLITRNVSTQDSGFGSQASGISTQDGAGTSTQGCAGTISQDDTIPNEAVTKSQDGVPDDGICMEDGGDDGLNITETVGISPGDKSMDSGIVTDNNDSGFQSPTSAFLNENTHTADNRKTVADLNEETPLYQKVHEWKQYMNSVFKNKKSGDFDIHVYGANIMENLSMGEPKKFGDIVKGKSSAEVTRFFMSTLQLANTMNIEIQGAQSGVLSNDTFAINLLTKERYYDRLNDYMAPSEEYEQQTRKKFMKKRAHSGEHSDIKRSKNDR